MIRPFKTKMAKVEEEIQNDRDNFRRLLEAPRELAKKDEKLAAALRNFSLL